MALLRALAKMMPRLTAEEQLLHIAAATSGNSATLAIEDVRRQAVDLERMANGGDSKRRRPGERAATDAAQSAEALAGMGIGVVMAGA